MNYWLCLRCCYLSPCPHDRPREAALNGDGVAPLDGDGDGGRQAYCNRLPSPQPPALCRLQPKTPPLVNGGRRHVGAVRQVVSNLFDNQLVNAFRLLNNWCAETRMRFGQDKTQWVVFDKTRGAFTTKDFSRYKQYRLCGFSPQVVEEYKYLGVTHHRQLKWDTQSEEAVKRIRRDSHLVTESLGSSTHPVPRTSLPSEPCAWAMFAPGVCTRARSGSLLQPRCGPCKPPSSILCNACSACTRRLTTSVC
jgi:hypothetical protein